MYLVLKMHLCLLEGKVRLWGGGGQVSCLLREWFDVRLLRKEEDMGCGSCGTTRKKSKKKARKRK